MERRGVANPYLPAAQPPEDHLRHLYNQPLWPERAPQSRWYSSSTDDQTLALALSRLNLSSDFRHQTPPFRYPAASPADVAYFEANPLSNCFYYPFGLREQQLSNVALMRAENGVFYGNGSEMGYYSGPHMDYMVGPGLNFGGGGGLTEPPSTWCGVDEARARVNLDVLNQWGRGYNDHGHFLQCKKPMPMKINTHHSILPQNDELVENFVSNTKKKFHQWKQRIELLPMEDCKGKIVSLAKDQRGSKTLQMKMEEANEDEIELVLSEVIDFVGDLMKNQFGGYFIQKLFVKCNEEQRTRIVMVVTKSTFQLVGVCINPHGAKAMQNLLENLNTPEQISLVMSALWPAAVELANDPNGQHVIRYCIVHFSYEYKKHLLNEIAENFFRIATDKSGCCVLQVCVEHSHGEAKERIINEIIANAILLAEDPYGNYVVQHLVEQRIPEVTADLLRRLQGYFASLSCNKYASNVVERFLVASGEENANKIVMELLTSSNASMLLLDPFANFVIQSALSVSKGHIHGALLNIIRANASSMRNNIYGKRILASFDNKKAPLCV